MPPSLTSQAARAMNRARKNPAGGRPRSRKQRCPCDVMTLKRARARGKSSATLKKSKAFCCCPR